MTTRKKERIVTDRVVRDEDELSDDQVMNIVVDMNIDLSKTSASFSYSLLKPNIQISRVMSYYYKIMKEKMS